jgi:cell division septal protein FtsQ
MSRARTLRRIGIALTIGSALVLLGTTPIWGPDAGRRIEYLQVRRVEVSGTRFLAPHEVLETSGIRRGMHLLDDRQPLQSALLGHPAIASAEVLRKPPHTLRVRIQEKQPVAYVSDGTLKTVDSKGEILPFDPTRIFVDLPIVRGSLADSAQAEGVRRMLAETQRLTLLDAAFMREISEIRLSARSEEVMVLTHRAAEVLVPIGLPASRIAQLRAVMADMERRFPPDSTGGVARSQVDLRFADQIVVRPLTPRELL